ncbi:MAG: DUF3795 domain-containing protein [candidate division WOR-3 bacterium]|nr:DUF3795 domain-containing protein [candidate division WOR-3 bacterium]
MLDINEAKKMVGYCGAFCGDCGMYKGRIYAMVAQELLEIIKSAGYSDWLPKAVQLDFNYDDFIKGLEYFSQENSSCYCQEPCKQGGGAPCKIKSCAKERGIEICYECKDFACEHFSWLLEKYPNKLLDYEQFEKLGFEGWLKLRIKRGEKGYAAITQKYYSRAKK